MPPGSRAPIRLMGRVALRRHLHRAGRGWSRRRAASGDTTAAPMLPFADGRRGRFVTNCRGRQQRHRTRCGSATRCTSFRSQFHDNLFGTNAKDSEAAHASRRLRHLRMRRRGPRRSSTSRPATSISSTSKTGQSRRLTIEVDRRSAVGAPAVKRVAEHDPERRRSRRPACAPPSRRAATSSPCRPRRGLPEPHARVPACTIGARCGRPTERSSPGSPTPAASTS